VFGLPPLIVLDEPNANLDQAGEAALAESILELKKRGCTLLIVGHRPSTIAQADKVLLLADGEVQAFGPRNEVLERMRDVSSPRPAAEQPAVAGADGAEAGDSPDEVAAGVAP
jgi:ATP-binding cassette subfamily C protein/ATP-binding cassette subfamily C exporter for protease/lipase/ATP-binding cassette subfamily C protein EexD